MTRNLPNGHLDMRNEHVLRKTPIDLLRGRQFEEQLQRFTQVLTCLFDRIPLTGDVEFRAKGYVPIAFASIKAVKRRVISLASRKRPLGSLPRQPSMYRTGFCPSKVTPQFTM